MSRIVDTDNFGGDYPNERFVLGIMSHEHCQKIADVLNEASGPNAYRYYKVVEDDYVLEPGFEP
jgi:hypothetical protein